MMDAENVRLGEICTIQYGFAFNSKKFTEDDSKIPLIRIRDVKRGFSNTYYDGPFSSEYLVHKGDLLVGMDGEFNIARWKSQDALLNQRVCKIVANSNVDEEYLRFYLKRALKDIENKTSFVTVKHLSAKKLSNLVIKLPKKNIQISISKQLSFLESLIHNFNEENVLFDELVKARFVEMFGDPLINEKGWKIRKLKNISNKIGSGATPKGGKEVYIHNGISLIRSMNVYNNRFEYKELAHITDEQAKKLSNVKVEKNDILLNITGASVARCYIVPIDILPARVNQHVCIIRCKEIIHPIFLHGVITNKEYQNHLLKLAGTGATREAINKQQIESLDVIFPPIELQNQFADFVKEVDKSRFVEMFGDIISNDKNWNSKPLKELCDISRGASPRPISDYLGGTIPWIKIGDATIGDSIYINSTKEHIIKEGVRKSRFIKKGSLIFANCGVSLGFCRIINFDGCIHDGWLAFQNIDTSLNKIFLLTTINQMTGYFRKIAPGGTQPNLNTDIVGNYIQVVPPLELQNQFADFVKEVDKSRFIIKSMIKEGLL